MTQMPVVQEEQRQTIEELESELASLKVGPTLISSLQPAVYDDRIVGDIAHQIGGGWRSRANIST